MTPFRLFAAFLLLVLFAAPGGVLRASAPPPLIPLEDFFRNPETATYRISPDGAHLAWLAPWENRLNIHVRPLAGGETIRVTSSRERDIFGYFWANDDTLVYIQDTAGDENFRIFSAGRDGSGERNLTPFDRIQARIIDPLRDDPDHMVVALNRRDPRFHDAYRLNINDGDLVQLIENPGYFTSYLCDNQGRLRLATSTDGVSTGIFHRPDEEADFELILQTDFRVTVSPLFFTFDDRHLYASSNLGRDKQAIVVIDPENGEEAGLVFLHPDVDVSNLLRSRAQQRLLGVSFTFEKTEFAFFDEDRLRTQLRLEAAFPGLEIRLTSSDDEETRFIVATFSDRNQVSWHLYDTATGEITHLADAAPWLNPDHLAEMKPIRYTARDGLTIHGYLTLPRGVPAENLPVVVNPHGGPWARDYWGYNPEVQFLANRGYAVFQMNFRGSTGFGREFWEASFGEWGRRMQDDVTDGVEWLIGQGIADPDRIAIYGGSYGGYKALAGLTSTPELYAAGVSFVGVSNLMTFMDSIPPYWEHYRQMLYEMVGNPEDEEGRRLLEAASPVNFVDRIQAPLLIAQGANDPRVVKAESDQMVEALRARGIDIPYMVKWDEGHGFANEENRFSFYRALEQFLAGHLGGRKAGGEDILGTLYDYEATLGPAGD